MATIMGERLAFCAFNLFLLSNCHYFFVTITLLSEFEAKAKHEAWLQRKGLLKQQAR